MYDQPEFSVHSAKALSDLNEKKTKEAKQQEAASNLSTKLATDQISLLKEANALATRAQLEAQESKSESERSIRMAFLSNIIAAASFLVAIASLVFSYVSSST
jgi:hypothetical protein